MTAGPEFQATVFDTATIADLFDNPAKFGAPTFEEFKRNPDRFRSRTDEVLAVADAGATGGLAKLIKKHFYFIRLDSGRIVKCESLEQIERVAAEEGINLRRLQMKPELREAGEGKYDCHVYFVPKAILELGDL